MKKAIGPQTLLYPMPAVLVGAQVKGKPNFMTAAWCGIAASTPPAISVAIRPARFTFEGISANNTFSINIPSAGMAEKVDYCGIYSGHKIDKSEIFQVDYGKLNTAPLIQECPVNLECSVIHSLDLGSHVLFVGEIMETYIDADCLTDDQADPAKIDALIYITSARQYQRLGDVVGRAWDIGKKKQAGSAHS
ncbi:MAG: flavin reductase family protein [Desulfobacterales bacterium]|jgi:flavin reductase (DIM6/NTAB) family NADH-FMN oxidoreductase RutF